MKTNEKLLHYAALVLTLSAASPLVASSAQAQVTQQSQAQITQQSIDPGPGRIPLPGVEEAAGRSYALARTAAASLHAGNYAQAEAEARQSVSIEVLPGVGEEVLATALVAQGKDQEALQMYHVMVVDQKNDHPRNLLPYALLLLKIGQWRQALTVYNQVLPRLGSDDLEQASSNFSLNVPQPTALAVALHIVLGQLYSAQPDWAGEAQNTEAMGEYTKALQLAPDNALANFYYGQGWQQLSPAEQSQFATAQQARAALQKAVKLGKGDVKKAAQKALQMAMKPK